MKATDLESVVDLPTHRKAYHASGLQLLWISFQTIGIIYGDIGTSPLYTVNAVFPASNGTPSKEDTIGVISAIFWSFTIVPVLKYCAFCMQFGTAEGEGGPFALLCNLMPDLNPNASMLEDEDLTLTLQPTMMIGKQIEERAKSRKGSLYKFNSTKWLLLVWTLFGTSLTLSDGILTPAVSVVSAVEGIAVAKASVLSDVVPISIAILVVLFGAQSLGTGGLSKIFAPVVAIWLLLLAGMGISNITYYAGIFRALDPSRAVMYFVRTGNYDALSGILLAITGVEAFFANLGQFSPGAIRISCIGFAYPCLMLAYFGQGARLIHDYEHGSNTIIQQIFYNSIPGGVGGGLYWIVFVFAILATIIASQAMISGCFSLVQQLVSMKCFPSVKIVHTSDDTQGRIYIPSVNYLVGIACVAVVGAFQTNGNLTNAYGFAIATVMIVTTTLMSLSIYYVKGWSWYFGLAFFIGFGFVDALFWGASLRKVTHGAWFPLSLGSLLVICMTTWYWAKSLEANYDREGRMRLSTLLSTKEKVHSSPDEKPTALQYSPDHSEIENTLEEEVLDEKSVPMTVGSSKMTGINQQVYLTDSSTPMLLARLPVIALFHKPSGGKGAPKTFSQFLKSYPSLPRVIAFLTVRRVALPRVPEKDRFIVNKIRNFEGFYTVSLRLGYRDTADMNSVTDVVVEKIIALERKNHSNDKTISAIEEASKVRTHLLPSYHIISKKSTKQGSLMSPAKNIIRKIILEEIYRRVAVNFPDEADYEFGEDGTGLLRITINAAV